MQFRARPLRMLSLLVLIAVTNVFVFANGTVTGKNANALLGKLITTSNRPVLVNGGDAITGTIILSGAQLVTSAAGGATVQLDKLGTVLIAPSSTVTVTFDLKSVTASVATGYAMVTTVEGVTGTVIGPDGTPAGGGSKPPAAPAPAGSGGFNSGDIAGVAVGGVGIIIGFIALNRANNARDAAAAAAAAAASAAAALAAARACLAGQTASPVKVCTSF